MPGRAGTPQELQPLSPVPLPVGHVVGPQEVQLALADDADVDVAARAQVVVDAGCDGVPHQLLGLLLLARGKAVTAPVLAFPGLCVPVPVEAELGTVKDAPTPAMTCTAVKVLRLVTFVPRN